ncbi:uncharacterized protein TM35_000181190 [Trypanosoma theileri]|uniref:Uncharacterized protein n=1 Tax=Trypanosoma theileri TaxID=67003 RepID=A0A1X0NTQ5_9TRYP|nr:uncharacterized protein TM35_000181190 [Trypanosoma theileri]ORC88062.1 hypothetical protein TM35_000181190 [Trypanosoma theileri]
MVLDNSVPFKLTLHPSLYEEKSALSIPLSFTADVDEKGFQHRLEIRVPSSRHIAGMEIRNVEFLFDELKNESCQTSHSSSSDGVLGYLFAQLLDSQGRPSSHPFAVMCCDTSTGRGVYSCVRLPFQADQRVRFYLVQKNKSNDESTGRSTRIEGVRFTGNIQLVSGGAYLKSNKSLKQIQSFMQKTLKFEPDSDGKKVSGLKRHRESPQSPVEENKKSLTSRSRTERAQNEKRKSEGLGNDEEPPQLIYAFVPGGDDES